MAYVAFYYPQPLLGEALDGCADAEARRQELLVKGAGAADR